jgi:hypothetical protein
LAHETFSNLRQPGNFDTFILLQEPSATQLGIWVGRKVVQTEIWKPSTSGLAGKICAIFVLLLFFADKRVIVMGSSLI